MVSRPVEVLARLLDARESPGLREWYQPSFNLAPTRVVPGLVLAAPGDRVVRPYRWGFGGRLFNARAETVATSRTFGAAWEARPVAVLADGFYEWTGAGDRRHPLFFRRADGRPLALAGLWEREAEVAACTIITTEAGDDLAGIHDRMPVVLELEELAGWLDPADHGRRRHRLLAPAPAGTLVHHPVDPRVGDVRNDGSWLIEPVDPPEEPLRLFG